MFLSYHFTSSFYDEVIDSNKIVAKKFTQDSIERRKTWEKNVKANVIPETGILQINVYDVDRNYASELVKNISYVLINKGAEYHGGGSDVELKIVDDVFISKYPVRPNIILNIALAFVIGFILGSAFVILNEAAKYKKETEVALEIQPSLFENTDQEKDLEVDNEDEHFEITDEQEPELASQMQLAEETIAEESDEDNIAHTEIKTMYDHLQ